MISSARVKTKEEIEIRKYLTSVGFEEVNNRAFLIHEDEDNECRVWMTPVFHNVQPKKIEVENVLDQERIFFDITELEKLKEYLVSSEII